MLAPTRSAVITELKASLLDSAKLFRDTDWPLLVELALADLSRRSPRHARCELQLQADRDEYPAPPDLVGVQAMLWGVNYKAHRPAWEPGYPGVLPQVTVIGSPGARSLLLTPAPTGAQIASLGARCPIRYTADHLLTDDAAVCTLSAGQLQLLLLRAQAEAMRTMSMHNISRPAQMRDGMNQFPRNSTPGALYHELMAEFERRTQ